MKNCLLLLTLSFALTFAGCSAKSDDIVETSYKSLVTAATVYDAAMNSAVDLYKQGLITEEQYNKVRDAALTYYDAYRAAVDVLYTYAENKDEAGKAKLLSYVDVLKASLNVLLTVVEGLGIDLSTLGVPVDEYAAPVDEVPAVDNAA